VTTVRKVGKNRVSESKSWCPNKKESPNRNAGSDLFIPCLAAVGRAKRPKKGLRKKKKGGWTETREQQGGRSDANLSGGGSGGRITTGQREGRKKVLGKSVREMRYRNDRSDRAKARGGLGTRASEISHYGAEGEFSTRIRKKPPRGGGYREGTTITNRRRVRPIWAEQVIGRFLTDQKKRLVECRKGKDRSVLLGGRDANSREGDNKSYELAKREGYKKRKGCRPTTSGNHSTKSKQTGY